MIGARASLPLAFIALLGFESTAVANDEMLARARNLYRNAAYDEALVVLDQMTKDAAPTNRIEEGEIRLFCLLALGRKDEARTAIGALVEADPFYQLSEEEASPSVRAVFKEVRQALLPEIVKRTYMDAKAAFERQDPESTAGFDRVIDLLNDPDMVSRPTLADLRIVTSAFRDLSKAFAQLPPPPPVVAAPVSAAPAASLSPASSSTIVYSEGDVGVAAPLALNQQLPPFTIQPVGPPRELQGTLELVIDANGTVTSATVSASIHPRYDPLLVKTAMSWKYVPGRKDGKPVPVHKVVHVRVRPN